MSKKILFVDDDANILSGYKRSLHKQFPIDTALGGEQGLQMIGSQGPYAVVVADMNMPGMNGIQLLTRVKAQAPDTVRFMLTGNADQATAVQAVNQGSVFQFLTKPCPPEMLGNALEQGLQQYRLVTAEKELIEKTLNGSIKALTDVLSMADPQSFGVGQKLRESVKDFSRSLKVEKTWEIEMGAMLSQLGLVTIPPEVLRKLRSGQSLSGAERDMFQRVPEVGANLIANIPRLENVARIVQYQEKNYDGTGFPFDDVSGDEIPVGARLLKVLSGLMHREQKGVPRFKALEEMRREKGVYDSKVLDAACACFDVGLPDRSTEEVQTQAVALQELRLGDVLAARVETRGGLVIAGAGTKVSQMVMDKMRNFAVSNGIKEPIYIEGLAEPQAAAA